jgi:hypothetical protein
VLKTLAATGPGTPKQQKGRRRPFPPSSGQKYLGG